MRTLLVIVSMLCINGCSNKAIYNNINLNERDKCTIKLPPDDDYLECIERTNKPYEEYERERKSMMEK